MSRLASPPTGRPYGALRVTRTGDAHGGRVAGDRPPPAPAARGDRVPTAGAERRHAGR
jgi:hypothetical protein